jgi:hypothetical protein
MTELLALELHRVGIFVAFATLAGVCLVIQWICWIAGAGRFRARHADPGNGATAGKRDPGQMSGAETPADTSTGEAAT